MCLKIRKKYDLLKQAIRGLPAQSMDACFVWTISHYELTYTYILYIWFCIWNILTKNQMGAQKEGLWKVVVDDIGNFRVFFRQQLVLSEKWVTVLKMTCD